jgi:TolA-binding protein
MDSTLMVQVDIDPVVGNKAVKAFTDFAYYCQTDSMSPVYLIKTAQVARALNNIPQAKLALEHCIETYPAFRSRPAAIFLLAQLYDEPGYLNNEAEAKKLYEKIISEYPNSDWAMSSQGAIHFIGKSDEEILKEIKAKK